MATDPKSGKTLTTPGKRNRRSSRAHIVGRWQRSMASTVSFATHGPVDRLSATHLQPFSTVEYAVPSPSGAAARLVCVTLSQFARLRSAAATFALGLLACRSEIGFLAPSRGLLEGFQNLPGPPCRSRKEDLAHVVTCRLAVNGNSDPWPACCTICFSWPVDQPEGGRYLQRPRSCTGTCVVGKPSLPENGVWPRQGFFAQTARSGSRSRRLLSHCVRSTFCTCSAYNGSKRTAKAEAILTPVDNCCAVLLAPSLRGLPMR